MGNVVQEGKQASRKALVDLRLDGGDFLISRLYKRLCTITTKAQSEAKQLKDRSRGAMGLVLALSYITSPSSRWICYVLSPQNVSALSK